MAAVHDYTRELPFIHRAWKTAVNHFSPYSMGLRLASLNGDDDLDDEPPARATKRRRLAEDSRRSFNGLNYLLSDDPNSFERVLRVAILKISHQSCHGFGPDHLFNGAISPAKKDSPAVRARCKLTICRWRSPTELRVLYCASQICTIKVFRGADDTVRMARIYGTPFYVPADMLYVERDDDAGFKLNDNYVITAELESAGDPRWPPAGLIPETDLRQAPHPRHWVLASSVMYKFEKHRMTAPVKVRKQVNDPDPTDLSMDLDMRWSTPHSPAVPARSEYGDLPLSETPETNNILRKSLEDHIDDDHNMVAIDQDDELDDVPTPSRSFRAREKKIYNLKALSDKARGLDGRGQKRRREDSFENGQVTWILPRSGEVAIENFGCVRCFAIHSSLDQLERHIESHPEFKYTIDASARTGIRIQITPHGEATPRPFRDPYFASVSVDGHLSESEDDDTPQKPLRVPAESIPAQPILKPREKPKDTRQLVPRNKQPMYDRLTKAVLEPGSLVQPPKVDDTWLVQKHRDIIQDYSDMDPDEKEYICEWDAFIIRERVTSELHLQEAYLSFVQTKASWLLSHLSRMTEFAKHLSYLQARKALTEETIASALAILREKRTEPLEDRHDRTESPKVSSPRTESRASLSGCRKCGQPVRGPSTLICSNLDCTQPFYHDDCVPRTSKKSLEWYCTDDCRQECLIQKGNKS